MKEQSPKLSGNSLSSVQVLEKFKEAMELDDFSMKFNFMSLFLRCITLLQRIHRHSIEHAPHDYPKDEFDTDGLDMNKIIGSMFLDIAGLPRHHGSMFPVAVQFLREVIENEGDDETSKAKSLLVEIPEAERSSMSEKEPSFENPGISCEIRRLFGSITV